MVLANGRPLRERCRNDTSATSSALVQAPLGSPDDFDRSRILALLTPRSVWPMLGWWRGAARVSSSSRLTQRVGLVIEH